MVFVKKQNGKWAVFQGQELIAGDISTKKKAIDVMVEWLKFRSSS